MIRGVVGTKRACEIIAAPLRAWLACVLVRTGTRGQTHLLPSFGWWRRPQSEAITPCISRAHIPSLSSLCADAPPPPPPPANRRARPSPPASLSTSTWRAPIPCSTTSLCTTSSWGWAPAWRAASSEGRRRAPARLASGAPRDAGTRGHALDVALPSAPWFNPDYPTIIPIHTLLNTNPCLPLPLEQGTRVGRGPCVPRARRLAASSHPDQVRARLHGVRSQRGGAAAARCAARAVPACPVPGISCAPLLPGGRHLRRPAACCPSPPAPLLQRRAGPALPRGPGQEPLRGPHVHHAGPAHARGAAAPGWKRRRGGRRAFAGGLHTEQLPSGAPLPQLRAPPQAERGACPVQPEHTSAPA